MRMETVELVTDYMRLWLFADCEFTLLFYINCLRYSATELFGIAPSASA